MGEYINSIYETNTETLAEGTLANVNLVQLKIYEACHSENLGTFVGRVVEDSSGEFCRQIDGIIDFSYNILDDNGNPVIDEESGKGKRERFRYADNSNYEKISQLPNEYRELNETLKNSLLELKQLQKDNPNTKVVRSRRFWINELPKTFVFFMVVKRHYRSSAPDAIAELDPCVPSCIVHRSKTFLPLLASAIAKKEGELKWKTNRKEFFSRVVGKYVFSIETSLIEKEEDRKRLRRRYDITFSIDDTTEEIPVTPEVLKAMEDLDKYWVPVDVFDEEMIKSQIEIVEKFIAELKAEIGAKPDGNSNSALSDALVEYTQQLSDESEDSSASGANLSSEQTVFPIHIKHLIKQIISLGGHRR